VLEHDLALRVQREADVEEAVRELRVLRLCLCHDVRVVLPGQITEIPRLRAGDVDRALAGERHVVQVEHLVVERLQAALRNGDQAYRQVEAGQPGRRLEQVRDVLQVAADIGASANTTDRRNEPTAVYGGIEALTMRTVWQ